MSLAGKTALVTGAASGIGLACAEALATAAAKHGPEGLSKALALEAGWRAR
ncbi:hypothetical protein [Cryptosporangium japonicum]|uniref:3-hydroxybutyrate dehydrogenase n=1 Tax=Cryptosporangium japonicum TaxID=80872 RepID=A0ABP3DDD9_9ACTN